MRRLHSVHPLQPRAPGVLGVRGIHRWPSAQAMAERRTGADGGALRRVLCVALRPWRLEAA